MAQEAQLDQEAQPEELDDSPLPARNSNMLKTLHLVNWLNWLNWFNWFKKLNWLRRVSSVRIEIPLGYHGARFSFSELLEASRFQWLLRRPRIIGYQTRDRRNSAMTSLARTESAEATSIRKSTD